MSDSIDTPPPAPETDNKISKKRKAEQKVWLKETQVNKFQSGIKYCLTGVTKIDSDSRPPTEYAQADQRRLVEALQTPRSKSDEHFNYLQSLYVFSPKITPVADGSGVSLTGSRKRDNHHSVNNVWLTEIKKKKQGLREAPNELYYLTRHWKLGYNVLPTKTTARTSLGGESDYCRMLRPIRSGW